MALRTSQRLRRAASSLRVRSGVAVEGRVLAQLVPRREGMGLPWRWRGDGQTIPQLEGEPHLLAHLLQLQTSKQDAQTRLDEVVEQRPGDDRDHPR